MLLVGVVGGVFDNPLLPQRWVLFEYNSFDQFPKLLELPSVN